MNIEKIYKIRRKSDGLFSLGGERFSKTGKIWKNIGHVRNHLRQSYKQYRGFKDRYELITYTVTVDEHSVVSLDEEIIILADKIKKEAEDKANWHKEYDLKRAALELNRIKEQFPDLLKGY